MLAAVRSKAQIAASFARAPCMLQRAGMSDVIVSSAPTVPVRIGQRSNTSGITATIFGSTGKLGPFVCDRLGSMGCMLLLPYRDDGMSVRANKVSGDPGQIAPVPVDFYAVDTVAKTMEKSNLVINMIGAFQSTRHYSLHDANVKTAYRIAKAAKEKGVERFIHLSALGASNESPSSFLRAKAESEEAVRYFYPRATIMRPAPMYSVDSEWIHEMAMRVCGARWSWQVEFGETVWQPVSAKDVAVAIQQVVAHPEIDGNTWELIGSEKMKRADIADMLRKMISSPHERAPFRMNSETSMLWGKINSMIPLESLRNYSTELAEYHSTYQAEQPGRMLPGLTELGIKPANFTLGMLQAVKHYMGEEAPGRQGHNRNIYSWRPY